MALMALVLVAPATFAESNITCNGPKGCVRSQCPKISEPGATVFVCTSTNLKPCTSAVCRTPLEQAQIGRSPNMVTNVEEIKDVQTIVQSIVGWVQLFFYIIATLMIILAAYDYLSSGGDETKVKSAKGRVIYAIVAIAIAVVAGGVVTLVNNFVN